MTLQKKNYDLCVLCTNDYRLQLHKSIVYTIQTIRFILYKRYVFTTQTIRLRNTNDTFMQHKRYVSL